MPMLVKGEYDDPSIPVVLEMPISDNKLQIAAKVYARQTSLLCCKNQNRTTSMQKNTKLKKMELLYVKTCIRYVQLIV